MKVIKFSSYSSNEMKGALLCPIILIPIALILIFILKANQLAIIVGLLMPSFIIFIIMSTLLYKNLWDTEEIVFSQNSLEIFFRKARYAKLEWKDIKNVEIVMEQFEHYAGRWSGIVIRRAHNLKFTSKDEFLEYRLWSAYFSQETQENIVSALIEFLELNNTHYEVLTDNEVHSNTTSLLQKHYHTKDMCKSRYNGDTTQYHS